MPTSENILNYSSLCQQYLKKKNMNFVLANLENTGSYQLRSTSHFGTLRQKNFPKTNMVQNTPFS